MKKIVLLAVLYLFVPFMLMAQVSTTDKFTVRASGEVQPGGDLVSLAVGLEGTQIYTAYNLDIAVPEGMVFVQDEYGDVYWMDKGETSVYPYVSGRDGNTYTHTLSGTLQMNGCYRLACFSTKNENFTKSSGVLFNINVKATPYAKPGEYTIRMTGLNLTANVDGNTAKYVPEGDLNIGTVVVGTTATVPVNITAANKYGTCILPFAVDALPEGLNAYASLGINGNVFSLQEVTSLEPYTPYILYAENGYVGNFTGTVDAGLYPESGSVTVNGLTGVIVAHEVTSGYILQNQGEGARFYAIGYTSFSVPAGRCYLSEEAAQAHLRFEVVPTVINDMVADDDKPEVIYDLLGRRVAAPQSGRIYVSTKRGVVVYK